ncbi:MAG: ferritin-like domain-containing protein [Chloroflexota bacterium]|nr:ferritin-like domain-containing protein [Chloroflexota bacterium]
MNTDKNFNEDSSSQILTTPRSRRSLIKGAAIGAVGVTGLAAAGIGVISAMPKNKAHAASASGSGCSTDSLTTILSVAATAEALAVTFYSHGIKNAAAMGITGQNLRYLTAAVVEEQLHLNLLVGAGGTLLAKTFSFPDAANTFTNLGKFVRTLDQLETAFESAYIAAIREFADMGDSAHAELSAQIVTIEAEHRALGRSLLTSINTANNWAFTPVYVKSVSDAVNVLNAEGYLSPSGSNSYAYHAHNLQNPNVTQRTPYAVACV